MAQITNFEGHPFQGHFKRAAQDMKAIIMMLKKSKRTGLYLGHQGIDWGTEALASMVSRVM